MKPYKPLFFFVAILAIASLACMGGGTSATSTAVPTNPPPVVPTNPPPVVPTSALANPPANPPVTGNNNGGSGPQTVADQNDLYQFELPGDWTYEATDLGNAVYSDVYMYADTWRSPDQSALIEGIAGSSQGFDFNGTTSTRVALDLLNYYYSTTGKEGDIKITKTSTAKDGSTRFDWNSKSGDYSGISWFEVRGTRTFLMWTVNWSNTADQSRIDEINNAINTYQAK
ncbi:MAG: hypothetical protein IT311_01635 [Anaerolineales bacterium]|nr:hypothetical protein [Anaerolineales bacterium]MCZ2123239.1 hypothetical protein [Anaerolineales bacterium]